MKPRGRNLAVSAVFTAIALGAAACGSSTGDGLTTSPPSPAQSAAMGHYFQTDGAVNPILGSGHGACETYSMATRHDSTGHLIAYTQEFCYECPDTSGITPAVFVLNGDTVTSVRAASAEGGEDFDNQVHQIFPPSLWARADADIPHVEAIEDQAHTNAHCG